MSIANGLDWNRTNMQDFLVGLYYYYLDKELMNQNRENSSIFGYVPTIQSISYNPFLNTDTLVTCVKSDFDKGFFGVPSENTTPNVFRISHIDTREVKLGSVNIWNMDEEESKLNMYPFKYYLLCDHLNPPLLIKPQLVKNGNTKTMDIYVRVSLSQTSKYTLFCKGYKNDFEGNIEGITNNNPLQFPVGSSAYSQFLATSGNSFTTANTNALLENDITFTQTSQQLDLSNKQNNTNSIVGGIASLLSLNLGGVVNNGLSMYQANQQNNLSSKFASENHSLKEYQIETSALAKTQDLVTTPRTMKSLGNDSIFNIQKGNYCVELIEYGMDNTNYLKAKRYLQRYGYKVDRYGKPNFKSRKYYNFIKFGKCDIDNSKIPYGELEEIQNILETGVTFWHIDNGAKIKNYNVDNKEV